MNNNDLAAALRAQGWHVGTDCVSDMVAQRVVSDRIVQILPGLRPLPSGLKLSGMVSLSTKPFSQACATIRGKESDFASLVRRAEGFTRLAIDDLAVAAESVTSELLDWAMAQDLKGALVEHAQLPTSAPGARPIWHLAALSLLGETETLDGYIRHFEAGDRLGFVNYISIDMILRARDIAGSEDTGTK